MHLSHLPPGVARDLASHTPAVIDPVTGIDDPHLTFICGSDPDAPASIPIRRPAPHDPVAEVSRLLLALTDADQRRLWLALHDADIERFNRVCRVLADASAERVDADLTRARRHMAAVAMG